jgi:uncharacterized protein (DUF2336 family)
MFWWSGPFERQHILLRFSAERTLLIDMCGDIFSYSATDPDPVVRKVLQVIERRQRDRTAIDRSPHDSLEAAIDAAAVIGITPEALMDIAALSGVKASTAERICQDPGGEGLAVLCKATGLKRQYLRALWTALRRPEDGPDFTRVSQAYETIAVAKAQTVLRYWNWSLSAAFSPEAAAGRDDIDADLAELGLEDVVPRAVFGR